MNLYNVQGVEMKTAYPVLYANLKFKGAQHVQMAMLLTRHDKHYLCVAYLNQKGFCYNFQETRFWNTFEFEPNKLLLSSDNGSLLALGYTKKQLFVGVYIANDHFPRETIKSLQIDWKLCLNNNLLYTVDISENCQQTNEELQWIVWNGFVADDTVFLLTKDYVYSMPRIMFCLDCPHKLSPYRQISIKDFFDYKTFNKDTTTAMTLINNTTDSSKHLVTKNDRKGGISK